MPIGVVTRNHALCIHTHNVNMNICSHMFVFAKVLFKLIHVVHMCIVYKSPKVVNMYLQLVAITDYSNSNFWILFSILSAPTKILVCMLMLE